MSEKQEKLIAELAELIRDIEPSISKIRSERVARLVPVYVVELGENAGGGLYPIRTSSLEILVRGITIGIQSERD